MTVTHFTVLKRAGTHADATAAVGLAHLLFLLSGTHPHIRDDGGAYTVFMDAGPVDIDTLDYAQVHDDPGYPYVLLTQGDMQAPASGSVIHYEEEKERLKAYRARKKALQKARGRLTAQDQEDLAQSEPMRGWYLYQNLNVLQSYGGYNALHHAIRTSPRDAFARAVTAHLERLARCPHAPAPATSFAPRVNLVQGFHPAAGKGTSRLKPDGTRLGDYQAEVLWFEEWLRYMGIHLCANALAVGNDIKVFVIAPASINHADLQKVRDDFVRLRLPWSSKKIDILSALGTAHALIRRAGLSQATRLAAFSRKKPSQIVAGIQTAYFTSLGSAKALTNVSFIGLPGWFSMTAETVNDWRQILEEHEKCIMSLNEEHTEDATLLGTYRDFLSTGDQGLPHLLEFLAGYAIHIMRNGDDQRKPYRLTETSIGGLITHMTVTADRPLTPILLHPGFQHVARAIRAATVTEQYYNSTGQQVYKIHYGLFHDLKRTARFKDQFVAALCDFLSEYNTENSRKAEQAGTGVRNAPRRRARVTEDDILGVVQLVDEYGPEPVAMLLLAYGSSHGSSRKPYEPSGRSTGSPEALEALDAEALTHDTQDEGELDSE